MSVKPINIQSGKYTAAVNISDDSPVQLRRKTSLPYPAVTIFSTWGYSTHTSGSNTSQSLCSSGGNTPLDVGRKLFSSHPQTSVFSTSRNSSIQLCSPTRCFNDSSLLTNGTLQVISTYQRGAYCYSSPYYLT